MSIIVHPEAGYLISRPHSADALAQSLVPWSVHSAQEYDLSLASPFDYSLGLDQDCRAQNLSAAAVMEEWVRRCPECDPDFLNALTEQDVRANLVDLMRIVDQYDFRDPGNEIPAYLSDQLEQARLMDMADPYAASKRTTLHSQRLFRSLAYISNRCRSTQLGLVLYRFFARNHRWIAVNNASKPLWQWCDAVMMSSMPESQKRDCLSAIHIIRPEIFDTSRTRGHEGAVRGLTGLVQDLVEMLKEGRIRRHLRRGSFDRGHRYLDENGYHPAHRRPRDYHEAKEKVRSLEKKLDRSRRELSRFGHDFDQDHDARRYHRSHSYDRYRYDSD